nr:MAG TPA: hypothetical protein [Caudoviricetes sp.]
MYLIKIFLPRGNGLLISGTVQKKPMMPHITSEVVTF